MIYDWDVEFELRAVAGTIVLNEAGDTWPKYGLVADRCTAGWDTRVGKANVPAQSGSILRRRFKTGTEVSLVVEPWEDDGQPACGRLLTEMMDDLRLVLDSLLLDTSGYGRLTFTPTGLAARIFDAAMLLDIPRASITDKIRTEQPFTLDSPFPYLMSLTQRVESVFAGTGGTEVSNHGTADFWPVLKVYGPFSEFLINHEDLGMIIVYDDSFPGAPTISSGEYIEIDTFRNTAFVDGDQADAWPGIDVELSDFFPIVPTATGGNTIVSDVDVDFLINDSWA